MKQRVEWSPSQHSIADVRDWSKNLRLEIQPDFQRRAVWSMAAKISLMETILLNIPMPKFLVASAIFKGATHRRVIDGQQRLRAILSFLDDEFPLASPYEGTFANQLFSSLPSNAQDSILSYTLDFNEIRNANDDVLRDIYSRVNKYNVKLNRQELRRADYPGRFLDTSEMLAQHKYFEDNKVFTPAQYKRNLDVEFVSELLLALIVGAQDKKTNIDLAYQEYAMWDKESQSATVSSFERVISDLALIFSGDDTDSRLVLWKSRFRQKADFYALFLAIANQHSSGFDLPSGELQHLRADLRLVDQNTRPSSHVKVLSEYGIRCSTDANSEASRKWRIAFLTEILSGTYRRVLTSDIISRWTSILCDLAEADPAVQVTCPVCNNAANSKRTDLTVAWARGNQVFQLTNARVVHRQCLSDSSWIVPLDEVAR